MCTVSIAETPTFDLGSGTDTSFDIFGKLFMFGIKLRCRDCLLSNASTWRINYFKRNFVSWQTLQLAARICTQKQTMSEEVKVFERLLQGRFYKD